MLLKIHAFSEFCGISVRTLHLYDKISLFSPYKTDDLNGYRYYDTEQMSELNTIISLKKIGIPLRDILEIKKNNYSKEILISMMQKQEEANRKIIDIAEYNNKLIDSMLNKITDYNRNKNNPNLEAKQLSKIVCFENDVFERDFSQILWL